MLLLTAALYTALALRMPGLLDQPGTAVHWALTATVTFAWLLTVQVWWQRRTKVTALLAAALSVHFLGNLLNIGLGLREFGSPQYLHSIALGTLFFVLMSTAQLQVVQWMRRTQRWPGTLALIDTLMIAAIAGLGVWVLGLDGLVTRSSGQPLLVGLTLTYSLTQILLDALTVMLLLRGVYDRILWPMIGGLLCFAVADLYMVVGAGAAKPWLSLLWVWGLTLLALGVQQVMHTPVSLRPTPLPPAVRYALRRLPYAALLVCCAVLLAGAAQGSQRQLGITVGTVAVFGLVMLRQAHIAQVNRQMQTELEASRQELEHLAYHDVLTGLSNRASFVHFCEGSLGANEPYVVFSLDLNGFKQINDTFGHAVGDRMLQHAAQQLARTVAAPGRVFRWGGDEFVIVVPGVQRSADADALARLIAVNIRTPMNYRGHQLSVGTSVGYALGRGNRNYETLLSLADDDMYSGKQRSGNSR